MKRLVASLIAVLALQAQAADSVSTPMPVPADYRTWVFLTASLDLNYNEPVPGAGRMSLLDNVFVNPDAYRAFLATGAWPDGTVFVKENRRAEAAGSIAREGKTQGDVASIELHAKDKARFGGDGWAFYVSDGKRPGTYLPRSASCYSCHEDHGAVDTTFVQYYPTLIETAKAKQVLSGAYLKDENGKHK